MGGRDAPARATHDADDVPPAPRPRAEPVPQRLPLDELHGDPDLLVVGADVVHGDDVWVLQARERLGLSQQPGARLLAPAHLAADHLERDLAIELRIVGGVDHSHPAGAELREDHQPTDDLPGAQRRGRRGDPRRRFGHRVVEVRVGVVRAGRRERVLLARRRRLVLLHARQVRGDGVIVGQRLAGARRVREPLRGGERLVEFALRSALHLVGRVYDGRAGALPRVGGARRRARKSTKRGAGSSGG